jgi:mitogen-activated protein kinase kinase kinase
MVRVTNYFDTQVRVPVSEEGQELVARQRLLRAGPNIKSALEPRSRKMSDEQLIGWYSKILDGVRLRHRKLQRFARCVCHLFSWIHGDANSKQSASTTI